MTFRELEVFYKGKKVLITGHTGFKGSWMCSVLMLLGADVYGVSLEPETEPALFNILSLERKIHHKICDVRDFAKLREIFDNSCPEVVFHLAAQPIVRSSYENPLYTYETNVMGTANLLECIRLSDTVKSVLNVTTDKVYENRDEKDHAFKEDEKLDGYDPYSNSKSCSELVTHSYKKSFLDEKDVAVSTARAGNVIGGGDYSKDRIIPDCVRAFSKGEKVVLRNPHSTRPYQHVLEPVFAYLMIAMAQTKDKNMSGYYNVGPELESCVTTGELTDLFAKFWGNNATWVDKSEKDAPHEAGFLRLDCSKLKSSFGWIPFPFPQCFRS